MSYLARLEVVANGADLDRLTLCRRTQWHMVAKAPHGAEVSVGAVVSAVDSESVMLASFDATRDALAAKPTHVTFRRAPFHQGWASVETEAKAAAVVYLVLASGGGEWKPTEAPSANGSDAKSSAPPDDERETLAPSLRYGVVAYFDREHAPRERLGLLPLQGASITPSPSGAALARRPGTFAARSSAVRTASSATA